MILKNFLKTPPMPVSHEGALQKVLRRTLGLALIVLAFWWYWQSGEQHAAIKGQGIIDQTNLLAPENLETLEQFSGQFRKTYGMPLMIHIYKSGTPAPCMPEAVCIRIFPSKLQSDFQAPPLVLSLLGKDVVNDLQYTHFLPYLDQGTWPDGLAAALRKITSRLDASLTPQPQEPSN